MQISTTNNGNCTCNLQSQHKGWLKEVELTWSVPTMLDNATDWPTSTVVSQDGGPIVNCTVTLTSSDNGSNTTTLFSQTIDCPYNYGGVIKTYTTEVDYSTAKTFTLTISNVTFLSVTTETNGVQTVHTDYASSVADVVIYRQNDDTESWGSSDEDELFIPFEDPFPSSVVGTTNLFTLPTAITVSAGTTSSLGVVSGATSASARYGGLEGLTATIPSGTTGTILVLHLNDATLGAKLTSLTDYLLTSSVISDQRMSIAVELADSSLTNAMTGLTATQSYTSQHSSLTSFSFDLETIATLPTAQFANEGIDLVLTPVKTMPTSVKVLAVTLTKKE